ncbi:hypothetical protein ACJJTC_018031, partial [Scirpophaga incertulas]
MPRWKKPTAGRLARCRFTSLTSRSAVSATRGFMCNGVRLARCRLTSLTSRSAVSATRGFMCNGGKRWGRGYTDKLSRFFGLLQNTYASQPAKGLQLPPTFYLERLMILCELKY